MNLEKVSLWRRMFQWKSVCDEINAEFDSHRSIHQMFERKLEHHKEQIEAHKSELEKAKAGNRTALKFIMQAHGLKLKLAIMFIGITLPCMAAFPPPFVHNNLDTNSVGVAPADGWFLVSTSSVPVWSRNGGASTNSFAVAQGTNILTTTNGSVVTVNGLTDTNVVNILLGAVTNGAILNLSNYVSTASQNATNNDSLNQLNLFNTANFFLKDEFPGGNLNSLGIGELGWRLLNSSGGSLTTAAPLTDHAGIMHMATGTAAADGILMMICGTTNSTSSELIPALNSRSGWTNRWIFRITATNDCVMYMGLVNNLIFQSTEPADWMGLLVDSTTYTTFEYTCRGSASSALSAGPALVANAWHQFDMYCTASGTISFSMDGAAPVTINTHVPTATLNPMVMIRKSAINNSVAVDVDYWALIITGNARF